jgi:osmotically-inducible protein OsmY
MGIVRRDEGDAAAQIASTTAGVQRVVKVFEYLPG